MANYAHNSLTLLLNLWLAQPLLILSEIFGPPATRRSLQAAGTPLLKKIGSLSRKINKANSFVRVDLVS